MVERVQDGHFICHCREHLITIFALADADLVVDFNRNFEVLIVPTRRPIDHGEGARGQGLRCRINGVVFLDFSGALLAETLSLLKSQLWQGCVCFFLGYGGLDAADLDNFRVLEVATEALGGNLVCNCLTHCN